MSEVAPEAPKTGLLTTDPGDPAPTPTVTPPAENIPEWRKALPDDIREEASLKSIPDINALAKSYVNAQRMIGVDKIPVPSKHATPEEWRDAFVKLGLPKTLDDYKVEFAGGLKDIKEDELAPLKKAAYELNMLPHQFKGMMETFSKLNEGFEENMRKQAQVEADQAVKALEKEWGMAFEGKLAKARRAFKEFATPEDVKFFEEAGFADYPEILRLFSKIGDKLYGEAPIKGEGHSFNGLLSPQEAQKEISKLYSDPAFLDGNHPNHKAAVAEMTRLNQMAYPEA